MGAAGLPTSATGTTAVGAGRAVMLGGNAAGGCCAASAQQIKPRNAIARMRAMPKPSVPVGMRFGIGKESAVRVNAKWLCHPLPLREWVAALRGGLRGFFLILVPTPSERIEGNPCRDSPSIPPPASLASLRPAASPQRGEAKSVTAHRRFATPGPTPPLPARERVAALRSGRGVLCLSRSARSAWERLLLPLCGHHLNELGDDGRKVIRAAVRQNQDVPTRSVRNEKCPMPDRRASGSTKKV